MSTRVSRPNGCFLSNVVFLGLAASVVAGCSESSSRFDNLFTSSVAQPQRIDGGQSFLPQADLSRSAPQQLNGALTGNQNQGLFNARNIVRQSQSNGFQSTQQVAISNPSQQQFGAPTFNGRQQIAAAPSIARQALPPVQSLPSQTIFHAPQSTLAQPSRSLNPSGGRLTLDQARELNDVTEGQPLLARQPQQQAFLQSPAATAVAPAQQFNTGTAWTRQYSPIPTSSPVQKTSLAPSSGPRGYTPPQGVYTSNVDRVSTSSVRSTFGAPKIIRSSVAQQKTQSETGRSSVAAKQNVDPITVTSVNRSQDSNSVNGGWSKTGGTYVALRQGETLYSISRRYGVPVKAITDANNISDPTQVRSGQQVLIPTYVYSPDAPISSGAVNKPQRQNAGIQTFKTPVTVKANASTLSQPLPPEVAQGSSYQGVYVVQKGDSLSGIAAKNNMSLASLRDANGLHTSDVIRIGQKLNIGQVTTVNPVASLPRLDQITTASVESLPAGNVSVEPRSKPVLTQRVNLSNASLPQVQAPRSKPVNWVNVATVEAPKVEASSRVAPAKAYTPPQVDPVVTSTVKAPAEKKKEAATTNFIWPVRGEVISRFGANQDGGTNDGINMNVPKGTPVRASASGEVIYASNGLADYGNLVLIRHSNGFVSAYAHNSKLSVRRGERVRQGQVIAKSGDTGSVKTPQLHFELRNGKKPVDPLNHLSG